MNQVVVIPYPGRGHINPIMSLCHLLSSRSNGAGAGAVVFTVVVTEEWFGMIGSDPKPDNVRFATIPNVIPSEHGRGSDMIGFFAAVLSKMEAQIEELLDKLVMEIPVKLIISDVMLTWTVEFANRRNIPVAAYWSNSAALCCLWYHVDLLEQHRHVYADLSERGEECIDYIPGFSPMKVGDITPISQAQSDLLPDLKSLMNKAQFFLIPTTYELEREAIDTLKAKLQIPIYIFGPNLRYHQLQYEPSSKESIYKKWLDRKSPETVLYVCFGSFLSVSRAQIDEIVAGLKLSEVKFLWVARGETSHLKETSGNKGLVVEWCDQLRVLQHSSIGGFWSHCGWSSVKESLFSGVPMLTFPIAADQPINGKFVAEDWKNGWKVRKEMHKDCLVMREEIAQIVRLFMDLGSAERKEMMKTVKNLQVVCQESLREGGSAIRDVDSFIKHTLT